MDDTENEGPAMTTEDVTGVESNPSPDNLPDAAVAAILDDDPNKGEPTDTQPDKSYTATNRDIQYARDALHEWVDTLESVHVEKSGKVELVGGRHHITLVHTDLANALLQNPPSLVEDEPEHRVKDKARQRR